MSVTIMNIGWGVRIEGALKAGGRRPKNRLPVRSVRALVCCMRQDRSTKDGRHVVVWASDNK